MTPPSPTKSAPAPSTSSSGMCPQFTMDISPVDASSSTRHKVAMMPGW